MNEIEKLTAPRFTVKDVTVHEKKRVYKGHFAVDNYIVSYKKFTGGETRKLVREIFERDAEAVAIVPYDPVTDEVVLIEQFRPGALNDPISPWLIEIVAGMIDPGETREEAACRELYEEAKLKITKADLELVSSLYPSPGGTSEVVSIYIARINSEHLATNGGLAVEDEDIRIFKVKAQEAFNLCKTGRICNCAAMVGLMYLELNYDKIRQKV